MKIGHIVPCIALVLGGFAFGVLVAAPADAPKDDRLPACVTEDQDNCYWDAQTMGNGQGTDSVVIVP